MSDIDDLIDLERKPWIPEVRKLKLDVLSKLENLYWEGLINKQTSSKELITIQNQIAKQVSKATNSQIPELDIKIARLKGKIAAYEQSGDVNKVEELNEELRKLLDNQAR